MVKKSLKEVAQAVEEFSRKTTPPLRDAKGRFCAVSKKKTQRVENARKVLAKAVKAEPLRLERDGWMVKIYCGDKMLRMLRIDQLATEIATWEPYAKKLQESGVAAAAVYSDYVKQLKKLQKQTADMPEPCVNDVQTVRPPRDPKLASLEEDVEQLKQKVRNLGEQLKAVKNAPVEYTADVKSMQLTNGPQLARLKADVEELTQQVRDINQRWATVDIIFSYIYEQVYGKEATH